MLDNFNSLGYAMTETNEGAHDGEAGTYIMQDGKRVKVDPKILKPVPDKSKKKKKTKAAVDANKVSAADTNKSG